MKELGLNEFLSQADDFIKNAAIGEEFYSIATTAGKAVVISEDEFKILSDAMRILIGSEPKNCD